MKILAAASAGGHWIQLLRLTHAFEGNEVVYICTKKEFESTVSGSEFHHVKDVNRKNIIGLLKSFFQIWKLIYKIKPKLIISTGAAPGLMCIIVGRIFRIKTVWIDSIANVDQLSMSGKIATKFASEVYTQWPDLAKGKIKYNGNVLA
jgi:UDP-N-acetylglucosamine:LPS N-acetylglucosamine transferase